MSKCRAVPLLLNYRIYRKNACHIDVWNPISAQLHRLIRAVTSHWARRFRVFVTLGTHSQLVVLWADHKQRSLLLRGSQFWRSDDAPSHFLVLRKVIMLVELVNTCSAVLLNYWPVLTWWLLAFLLCTAKNAKKYYNWKVCTGYILQANSKLLCLCIEMRTRLRIDLKEGK
jgi:hypothetical protein